MLMSKYNIFSIWVITDQNEKSNWFQTIFAGILIGLQGRFSPEVFEKNNLRTYKTEKLISQAQIWWKLEQFFHVANTVSHSNLSYQVAYRLPFMAVKAN